jgi:hypothetical protein
MTGTVLLGAPEVPMATHWLHPIPSSSTLPSFHCKLIMTGGPGMVPPTDSSPPRALYPPTPSPPPTQLSILLWWGTQLRLGAPAICLWLKSTLMVSHGRGERVSAVLVCLSSLNQCLSHLFPSPLHKPLWLHRRTWLHPKWHPIPYKVHSFPASTFGSLEIVCLFLVSHYCGNEAINRMTGKSKCFFNIVRREVKNVACSGYIHYRSKVWGHLEMSLFLKDKQFFVH